MFHRNLHHVIRCPCFGLHILRSHNQLHISFFQLLIPFPQHLPRKTFHVLQCILFQRSCRPASTLLRLLLPPPPPNLQPATVFTRPNLQSLFRQSDSNQATQSPASSPSTNPMPPTHPPPAHPAQPSPNNHLLTSTSAHTTTDSTASQPPQPPPPPPPPQQPNTTINKDAPATGGAPSAPKRSRRRRRRHRRRHHAGHPYAHASRHSQHIGDPPRSVHILFRLLYPQSYSTFLRRQTSHHTPTKLRGYHT